MFTLKLPIALFLIISQVVYCSKAPTIKKNPTDKTENESIKQSKETLEKLAAHEKKFKEFLKWAKNKNDIVSLKPKKIDLSALEQQTLLQLYKEQYLLVFASYVANRYDWQLPAQFNLAEKTALEKICTIDAKMQENSKAISAITETHSEKYTDNLQKIAFEMACQECGNEILLRQLYK